MAQQGNQEPPTDTGDSKVPPYDDRSTGRQNEDQIARNEGPGRMLPDEANQKESITSPADEQPAEEGIDASVGGTGPAHQAGTRKGEDIKERDGQEAGKQDQGTKGETERPVGTSTDRSVTGVNPQKTVTESPTMPAGD